MTASFPLMVVGIRKKDWNLYHLQFALTAILLHMISKQRGHSLKEDHIALVLHSKRSIQVVAERNRVTMDLWCYYYCYYYYYYWH